MSDEFEDEAMLFLMKAIIVSGLVYALMPNLVGAFTANQSITPLSSRLYLDPETGNYWVYVPEEERRIRKGQPAYTEEEYSERLEYYLSRIPYKLLKMRYSSFTRYFGHLKRLGWVEETGKTEPSAIQDDYPPAPPRVYYHLTEAGWKASMAEISDPLMTLYHYSRAQRSAKNRLYTRV